MLKLVQLLALAAVVAIAASTPVSHLFKDDKVDMALEDLEVLADALDKETSAAADVNPLKPPCTGCTTPDTPMTESEPATPAGFNGVSSVGEASGCCPRGQYGDFTQKQCYPCNTGETSVVGEFTCQNTARTACFKCDACNVLSPDMRCRKKCTAQTKPDCSLTATKDRSGKNIQAGACYKK